MLPFLFCAYLLLEYLEHNGTEKMNLLLKKYAHRFGPMTGAILGCVPHCGFSVAASNFYAAHTITAGTLLAVFLSTSDEALPILLSHPEQGKLIGSLLLVKVLWALIVGATVDTVLRHRAKKRKAPESEQNVQVICEHCHCEEQGILRSAIHHTLEIFLFILIISFALNAALEFLGEDTIAKVLLQDTMFQPLLAAVIGLIPNCAVSVALTTLYLEGALSFGAMTAGLSTGAGMGVVVLLRMNKNSRENAALIVVLLISGMLLGTGLQLFLG